MSERYLIRNSTAEFLIFQLENKEQGIEVMYADETIWCTQKAMAALFDVGVPAISKHLANVFETGELKEDATISKMETVQQEGTRAVKRTVVMYKLDAIIAVGYRVNSIRATQFRQWATAVLRQFAVRGYVLDRKRMENGSFLNEDYFEHLLAEIREIRLSERRFYQKLTDIYATSVDYNRDAPTTRLFFKMVQKQDALCSAWPHGGRTDNGTCGCRQRTHGADHMGECSRWKNRQDRCLNCQELFEADRTGGHGAYRDGSAGVCRDSCQTPYPNDDGGLG